MFYAKIVFAHLTENVLLEFKKKKLRNENGTYVSTFLIKNKIQFTLPVHIIHDYILICNKQIIAKVFMQFCTVLIFVFWRKSKQFLQYKVIAFNNGTCTYNNNNSSNANWLFW